MIYVEFMLEKKIYIIEILHYLTPWEKWGVTVSLAIAKCARASTWEF